MKRGGVGAEFANRIDGWVISAVGDGARSFEEVVLAVPSVFPVDVLTSLKRLTRLGTVSLPPPGPRENKMSGHSHSSDLPIPHLLDYDWRFEASSARFLLDRALALSEGGDLVYLVGTPTLAAIAASETPPRSVVLVDWNHATVNGLRGKGEIDVHHGNVAGQAPGLAPSRVVVLDPPWYLDYFRAFLTAAARWCEPGGHVLLTVPPVGTRAEMDAEHRSLLEFCRLVGFDVVSRQPLALHYTTPPFEINAIRAGGVWEVPSSWRRGDLWVLRRHATKQLATNSSPLETGWSEASLDGIRLKIHIGQDRLFGDIDPRLVSVVGKDICPSVSRKHPLRASGVVWTSGNRVFDCASPAALIVVCQALSQRIGSEATLEASLGRPLTERERACVRQSVAQLRRIASIECLELLSFGHAYSGIALARNAS